MVNYHHLFNKYIFDRQAFKEATDLFLKCLGIKVCIESMGKDKAKELLSTKEAVFEWCDLLIEIGQMVNH